MTNTYIYGLRDPRDWRIRYIGRTVWPFAKRMSSHLHVRNPRHYTRRENWIQKLVALGLKPQMEFLECVPGNGFEAERKWIANFRRMGHDLVNGNEGGAGVVMGHEQRKTRTPFPEETRKKFSEMYTGKPVHPNFAATWERRRGKPAPKEEVEKRAAKLRGRHHSEEHKRKIRETNLKTWADPALREKHREIGRAGAIKQWEEMTEEEQWEEMTEEDITRWIELHGGTRRKS